MQGLVNFAGDVGNGMAILLPTFCYLMALICFLAAAWGFWLQASPGNPFTGRPWIPLISLLLSGAFSSFSTVLTLANASAGTNLAVTISPLTTYTPPTVPTILGATPGATMVELVTLFQLFFQAFGAMACFFAMVRWRAVINGETNSSQSSCFVQFVFGIMLINVLTVAQWLQTIFQA
jgi:hypothetical protein